MDSETRMQLVQRLDSIQRQKDVVLANYRNTTVEPLKAEDLIVLVSSGKVVLRSAEELLEAIKDDGRYDEGKYDEGKKRRIKREMSQDFRIGGTLTIRDLYDFSEHEETQKQRYDKAAELVEALQAKGDELRDLAKFTPEPDALKLIADFESYKELG